MIWERDMLSKGISSVSANQRNSSYVYFDRMRPYSDHEVVLSCGSLVGCCMNER